jgi:hypothetical protein
MLTEGTDVRAGIEGTRWGIGSSIAGGGVLSLRGSRGGRDGVRPDLLGRFVFADEAMKAHR